MTSTAITTARDNAERIARIDYIAGLRKLADVLEEHDDLVLPFQGARWSTLDVFVDTKDEAVAWSRAIPGRKDKAFTDGAYGFKFTGALAGLHLQVFAQRDQVCERIVVGTETVTTTVKDPEALAAVPEIEVTETVEQVEWRCSPLLADRDQVAPREVGGIDTGIGAPDGAIGDGSWPA